VVDELMGSELLSNLRVDAAFVGVQAAFFATFSRTIFATTPTVAFST
jgi:hypothetical protein